MIAEISRQFFEDLRAGNKMTCPCCKRYAQIYNRQLHHSVALQLIMLFKKGGSDHYVHVRDLVTDSMSGAGDFTKAKYWGLIQESPISEDGKKSSGFWKLTDEGVLFVRGVSRSGRRCSCTTTRSSTGWEEWSISTKLSAKSSTTKNSWRSHD